VTLHTIYSKNIDGVQGQYIKYLLFIDKIVKRIEIKEC